MADRTPAEIAAELERLLEQEREAARKGEHFDHRHLHKAAGDAYRSGHLHVLTPAEAAMVEAVRAGQKVCVPVVWTTEMKAAAAKAWDDAGGFCDEVGLQAALAAALAAAQGEG